MLGDHGVRKYEYETGIFTSVDPLWDKYYGWSPYQYSANNPVSLLDLGGRDIIVFLDREAANRQGHTAVAIGNDKDGWTYYSKDGTGNGLAGKSDYTVIEAKSLDQLYGDDNFNKYDYDEGYLIGTDEGDGKDDLMKEAAKKQIREEYQLTENSCINTACSALEAAGFDSGEKPLVKKGETPTKIKILIRQAINIIPKYRYEEIKKENNGTTINLEEKK